MQSMIFLLVMAFSITVNASKAKAIKYKTSADNSEQPAMFFAPASKTPVPLIVALHTWSGNYKQKYHKAIEEWCIKHGWAYIHPDFRGPNNRPEATGSELVVADIVSAVEYAKKTTKIDTSAIYLVPLCLSASHIAYGSIRMEPVFMILGQSAGTAAVMAIDEGIVVQDVDYTKLKARLLADKQKL